VTAPRTDYDGPMARVYRAGRALPSTTLDDWVTRVRQHLPSEATTLLDLGAGTGRFSQALADGLSVSKVHQVVAPDGWALLERTKLRADSVLARLGDAAFAKGIDALTCAVQEEEVAAPVLENLDLLVFGLKKSKQLPVGG